MYRKAIGGLVSGNLLFLAVFFCFRGVGDNRLAAVPAFEIRADESLFADSESSRMGIVSAAASGQRIVGFQVLEKEPVYELGEQDREVLLRIVEAEAGCEDEEGKLLVANVVLNRLNSDKFPDTVTEVVFQREKGITQFSPVANGKIWSVSVSEETLEAVGRALEGEDISQGALYFAARRYADSDKMRWFEEQLCFLFRHGGHEFFR